jgi:hypothetical protein
MVSPPRSSPAVEAVSRKDLAERASRLTAMLDRWEAEDVSDEPDWSVEDLERHFEELVDAFAWPQVPLASVG